MSGNERVDQHTNSDTLKQSEIYSYFLQNEEPSNYTRIPNILNHLTYDYIDETKGQTEVRRLSVHAKELYRTIKEIAGDKGACWKNRDNLAELCNMSPGMISNCKKELSQKFHQLDGNPLIVITKHQKTTMSECGTSIINKTFYDKVMLVNVWSWNNAFNKTKAFMKKEGLSYDDTANQAPSPENPAPQEAPSPGDINKNPNNKISMSKEQQTASSDAKCCFLDKKERLFPSDRHEKIYDWLLNRLPPGEQPKEPLAYKIATAFNPADVIQAADYINERMKKHREKHHQQMEFNKGYVPYLQDVINNRYWEKK